MYWRPVAEMATTRMTEAVPMTMPSAVRAKRTLEARKLSRARRAISLSTMVCRALATVLSKDFRGCVRSAGMIPYRMTHGGKVQKDGLGFGTTVDSGGVGSSGMPAVTTSGGVVSTD